MRIVPVFGGPKTPTTLWWLAGVMLLLEGLAQLSTGWFGVFDLQPDDIVWRVLGLFISTWSG